MGEILYKNPLEISVDVQNQTPWLNSKDIMGNAPMVWKSWYDKGTKIIGDLLNEWSECLRTEEIHNKYVVKGNFLHILQIHQAFPIQWSQMLSKDTMFI